MRSVVVLALALSAGAVQAQTISILLLNAGQTDVGVEGKDKAVTAEVLPNQAKSVSLTRHQWLRLGQEVYRYDLRPIFSLKSKRGLVLQLGADGKLYLMQENIDAPGSSTPRQPAGFPISATRKVDLT